MVGLFGGTFDPVHEGHSLLARVALARYPFRKVYLVPARQNPLKTAGPQASSEERLEMLRLAVAEAREPRLDVLDWETRSDAPSYTIHTVERLLAAEEDRVVLIMGNEVFRSLPRWHEPQRLVRLADFVVVMREGGVGFEPRKVLEELGITDAQVARDGKSRLRYLQSTRWVDRMDMVALPVSATEMRSQLAHFPRDGGTPQGIGRSVWRYIKEKRLYTVNR